MKKFIVLGSPIKQSLSPILHNWIFKNLEINAKYFKQECNINNLENYIDKLRKNEINGINVTIPFKEKIIKFLDILNPRVALIGSVNCIVKNNESIVGFNTDWFGFSKLLDNHNINIINREAIIIGSGGASRAIIYALIQRGIKKINIFNRTLLNAKKLENDIVSAYEIDSIKHFINKKSIIINCTPLGMYNKVIPIPKEVIYKDQIIIDTIYNPYMTELLNHGHQKGAKVINGLDMFIYQGIASLEIWLGKSINDKLNFLDIKQYLREKL